MRTLTMTLLVSAAALLASCDKKAPTTAVTPAPPAAPTSSNAAPAYREVHAALGQPLLEAAANGSADAMLAQHSADIDRLVEATRQANCDFGVDWSAGVEAVLPDLPKMRALARVLKADAARLLAAGDADGAAKRAAAILRLANHLVVNARSSIELLVAIAIADLGAQFVTSNPGLARAAWKTDIQQAISEVSRNGTLNSGAVVRKDIEMVAAELRGAKAPDFSTMGGRNWATVTPAEREAAAKKVEALCAQLPQAWGGGVVQIKAVQTQANSDGVGEFFGLLDKVRESVDKLNASLDQARAALR